MWFNFGLPVIPTESGRTYSASVDLQQQVRFPHGFTVKTAVLLVMLPEVAVMLVAEEEVRL